MRIIIIKEDGYRNECPSDKYSAITKNHPTVELNNRYSIRYGQGSVGAYNPNGLYARVYGSKLLKGSLPSLWREYSRLWLTVGFNPTRAAWEEYLKVLSEWDKSDKLVRWVIVFKS